MIGTVTTSCPTLARPVVVAIIVIMIIVDLLFMIRMVVGQSP
jgi:hypothetical protein